MLVSSKKHKMIVRSVSAPLETDIVLDIVLSFVGINELLYAAGISRRWRERYLVLSRKKQIRRLRSDRCCTSHRSALISASRLQWALDSKLTLRALVHERRQMFFANTVVAHSLDPTAVMTVARAHGLQLFDKLAQCALQHENLELLLWLVEHGCPWALRSAAMNALHSVPMLQRIRTLQAEPWPLQLQIDLMWEAGLRNCTAAVSWLHEQGTDWPYSFVRVDQVSAGRGPYSRFNMISRRVTCWPVAAVQLALSSGSTWQQWNCIQLRDSPSTEHSDSQRSRELFTWAHQNGCPCSCEADKAAAVARATAAAARTAASSAAVRALDDLL
jgi:hypothetical protein